MDDRQKNLEEIQQAFEQVIEATRQLGVSFRKMAEQAHAAIARMEDSDFEFATSVPREERERLRKNQSCALLHPGLLIYQVPRDVSAIYDAGVQIPLSMVCSRLEDLIAAEVSGGTYALCRECGMARLGTEPVGPVTCDGSDMTPDPKAIEDVSATLGKVLADMGESHVVGYERVAGFELAGKPRPIAFGRCENVEPIIPGDVVCSGPVHRYEGRIDAIDQIYESNWIDEALKGDGRLWIAGLKSLAPDLTPGTVLQFGDWGRMIVTEIRGDMAFFEPVESEPSDGDPEG